MHETIIEGRKLEKFYGDPGENVIQVIAPTDISVHADEILRGAGAIGFRQVHAAPDADRALEALGGRSSLAR